MEEIDFEELGLINPDATRENRTFDFDDSLQVLILSSILLDDYFLIQASHLLKPEFFRERCHSTIAKIVLDFYSKYNAKISRPILENEIRQVVKEDAKLAYYLSELDVIYHSYEPGLQKQDYLIDQIVGFAKLQSFRLALGQSTDLLKKKQDKSSWEKARVIVESSFLVERNVNLGLMYFDTAEERYEKMMAQRDAEDYFITGFPSLDANLSGGFRRKELFIYGGGTASGKSLNLIKMGKENLIRKKDVLYISLELAENKIGERFDSMLTNYPIRSLYEKDVYKEVIGIINESKEHHGRLIIKEYPAGTMSVEMLRAYIAQLHVKNIYPSLVIVDYLGEMADPVSHGDKIYELRQRDARKLRQLAQELNVGVATAVQFNRGAKEALNANGFIDIESIAESVGVSRCADAVVSIGSTDREAKASLGTMFVAKNRSGKGRFIVRFLKNPDTLEFEEISNDTWKAELSKVQEKTINDLQDGDLARDGFKSNRGNNKNENNN